MSLDQMAPSFPKELVMKRSSDDYIGVWRIGVGLALVVGMFQFAITQSEPPTIAGKESPGRAVKAMKPATTEDQAPAARTTSVAPKDPQTP